MFVKRVLTVTYQGFRYDTKRARFYIITLYFSLDFFFTPIKRISTILQLHSMLKRFTFKYLVYQKTNLFLTNFLDAIKLYYG